MKKIGILGCGWLGFPLAKKLIETGWKVSGTTRNISDKEIFKSSTIDHFEFQLGKDVPDDFINDIMILIIAFPITNKISADHLSLLISSIQSGKNARLEIIFTSSISVYENTQAIIDETNGRINLTSPNYIFEQQLKHTFAEKATIVRLGGLIGEDRHPVYHLAGRIDLTNGNAPVNLVHRSDVMEMIVKIIQTQKFGHVYNCVYPEHPEKQKYYLLKANEKQLIPPKFIDSVGHHKTVLSTNAKKLLNFSFNNPI